MKKRAVFFDRDGVLIRAIIKEGKAYSPRHLDEVEIVGDGKTTVEELAAKGFVLVVVTNQPDIARKKLSWDVLNQINQHIVDALGGNALIQSVYVCPHDNQDGCSCRKPKPGMLEQASQDYDIELGDSVLIGDREVDMLAAKSVGTRTVLMDASYNQDVEADYRAKNLTEALCWILDQDN